MGLVTRCPSDPFQVSDPPTKVEIDAVVAKLNLLLAAARGAGLIAT